MAPPRHEFVVLAYGDSPYLAACLASLRAQASASPIRVTTSTPSPRIAALAAAHDAPLHIAPPGRGIAADWNAGLAASPADLVTLAHQDDLYYPAFAAETVTAFDATPTASLAFTDYDEIGPDGALLPRGRLLQVKKLLRLYAALDRPVIRTRSARRRLLAFGSAIPCPSVTLNLARLRPFAFAPDFQINLDWDAWWRLHARDAPFLNLRDRLMAHRIHPAAETAAALRDGRRAAEDAAMFARIWPRPVAAALARLFRLAY